MRAIIGLAIAALIAVGAYFGLTAAGVIGGPAAMTPEDVTAGLTVYADDINDDDNLRFDDFSNLVNAVVVERQITIRGETITDMADVSEGYLESREAQGLNRLCSDDTNRALLANGATYVFNWFSADGESIGMVTIRGAQEPCEAAGL